MSADCLRLQNKVAVGAVGQSRLLPYESGSLPLRGRRRSRIAELERQAIGDRLNRGKTAVEEPLSDLLGVGERAGRHHEPNVPDKPEVQEIGQPGEVIGVGVVDVGQVVVEKQVAVLLKIDERVRVECDDERTVVAERQEATKRGVAETQAAVLGHLAKHTEGYVGGRQTAAMKTSCRNTAPSRKRNPPAALPGPGSDAAAGARLGVP